LVNDQINQMDLVLWHKFMQNKCLKEELLETQILLRLVEPSNVTTVLNFY